MEIKGKGCLKLIPENCFYLYVCKYNKVNVQNRIRFLLKLTYKGSLF